MLLASGPQHRAERGPDIPVDRAGAPDHPQPARHIEAPQYQRHPYRANGRTWSKIRTRLTAEAIVGGVIGSLEQLEALILGRHDHRGRLHVAGRTTPLPPPACTEISAVLTRAAGGHPWLPAIPSSRFGQLPSEPIEYLKVAPATVVELDVDTAFENHRWRHGARFVRVRAELRPEDLSPLPGDAWSE
jgi:hypothetical protein